MSLQEEVEELKAEIRNSKKDIHNFEKSLLEEENETKVKKIEKILEGHRNRLQKLDELYKSLLNKIADEEINNSAKSSKKSEVSEDSNKTSKKSNSFELQNENPTSGYCNYLSPSTNEFCSFKVIKLNGKTLLFCRDCLKKKSQGIPSYVRENSIDLLKLPNYRKMAQIEEEEEEKEVEYVDFEPLFKEKNCPFFKIIVLYDKIVSGKPSRERAELMILQRKTDFLVVGYYDGQKGSFIAGAPKEVIYQYGQIFTISTDESEDSDIQKLLLELEELKKKSSKKRTIFFSKFVSEGEITVDFKKLRAIVLENKPHTWRKWSEHNPDYPELEKNSEIMINKINTTLFKYREHRNLPMMSTYKYSDLLKFIEGSSCDFDEISKIKKILSSCVRVDSQNRVYFFGSNGLDSINLATGDIKSLQSLVKDEYQAVFYQNKPKVLSYYNFEEEEEEEEDLETTKTVFLHSIGISKVKIPELFNDPIFKFGLIENRYSVITNESIDYNPDTINIAHPYGVDFDLLQNCKQEDLNEANKVIEWFFNHLFEIISNGKKDHYDYFISWIGHILFNPGVQTQKIIYIYGKGGTGKTVVMNFLNRLFGKSYNEIQNIDDLNSSFNSHYISKLIFCVNEAFNRTQSLRANEPLINKLKGLASGGETINQNNKNVQIIPVKPSLNLIIVGNYEFCFDDRRNFFLRVSEKKLNDQKYFSTVRDPEKGFLGNYSPVVQQCIIFGCAVKIFQMCNRSHLLNKDLPIVKKILKLKTKLPNFSYVEDLENKPQMTELLDEIKSNSNPIAYLVEKIKKQEFVLSPFDISFQNDKRSDLYIDLYSVYCSFEINFKKNNRPGQIKAFLSFLRESFVNNFERSHKNNWFDSQGRLVKRTSLHAYKFEDVFGEDSKELKHFYVKYRHYTEFNKGRKIYKYCSKVPKTVSFEKKELLEKIYSNWLEFVDRSETKDGNILEEVDERNRYSKLNVDVDPKDLERIEKERIEKERIEKEKVTVKRTDGAGRIGRR